MSDENRDAAAGQFASPAEPRAFGREGIEREAGFVPLADVIPLDKSKDDSSELTVKEAAAQVSESRMPESEIKTYGFNLPDNVALTLDEATELKSRDDKAERQGLAEVEAERIRAEVDALRGEKPDGERSETGSAPLAGDDKAAADAGEAKPDQSEVERLLAIPHVREAVEKLEGDYRSAVDTYRQGIEVASFMTRANLAEIIPDVLSLPAEHQPGAMAALAQREPDRCARATALLDRANQLTALYQEQQQVKAAADGREFSEFARTESAAFNEMIKDQPKGKIREVEGAIIEAIKEYGGDDAAFFELFKNTKILHSRVAQRLLYDAGQYRLMQKAGKAVASRSLPPVQAPGTAAPRVSGAAASIQNLERQFGASTGNKQTRIAAQLLAARRAARG